MIISSLYFACHSCVLGLNYEPLRAFQQLKASETGTLQVWYLLDVNCLVVRVGLALALSPVGVADWGRAAGYRCVELNLNYATSCCRPRQGVTGYQYEALTLSCFIAS